MKSSIRFFIISSLLLVSAQVHAAELNCSMVFDSRQVDLTSVAYSKKLFDGITTGDQLKLDDGSILKFEDVFLKNKIITKVTFPNTSWKGRSEFRLNKDSASLDVIVLPFENAPRWIKTKDTVGLDSKKGTPTSLYLLLRTLKKVGIKAGELKELIVDNIRHPETTIHLGSLLRDWHKSTKKSVMKVSDFFSMYEKTSLHRLTLLLIQQSGHQVTGLKLKPHADDRYLKKIFDPEEDIKTWLGNDDAAADKLTSYYADQLNRWKNGVLDSEALDKHIEDLMLKYKLDDLKSDDKVPMDFSVIYELKPM
ncbi:MAG: hypothetical protein AABY64_01480 [Bdellovibrionota bacterium]